MWGCHTPPPHCRHEQTFVGKKGEGEEGKEERKEKEGEEEGKKKEKKKEKEKEREEEGKKKEKKKEKEKKEKEEGGEEEACRDVLIGGVRGATLIINVISKNVSAKNGLSAREKERRGEGEREEKSYGQVIKRT